MKLFTSVRSISPFLMLFVIVAGLQACSGGGSASANNAPTASNVSITDDNGGTIEVGDSLTGSYIYADAESDAEGTSTFRWLRDGTAINGATSLTYTLVVADSDASITFEVIPIAATGSTTGLAVVSSTVVVDTIVNNAPTASNVSITDDNGGTIVVGDSLTGSYTYADAESDAEGTSTLRWLRDGTAISGATAKTYTLVHADSGASITFEVIPVASSGTTTGSAVTSSGTTTIPLAVGGFTKSFAAIDGSLSSTFPFSGTEDLKVQLLYTASEINGSGYISKLRFNRASATTTATSCENVTVKLGHTSLTALDTTFANNVEQGKGSQVTVLNNATVDIPVGAADEWFDIMLSTPFNYNGVDNLVVEVEKTTACSDSQAVTRFGAASDIRAVAWATDTAAGTAQHDQITAIVDPVQPWMQFVFSGGDNKQDFGGSTSFTYPFNTAASHIQQLYLASEIDGLGPLTGLAFQMNATSIAATYTSTITIGHTTLAVPGDNFANNFDVDSSTVTANAVTFNIPANIPAGEWFWVPLPDNTFVYNGTDNLIVDMVTTAGSVNNAVRIEGGITRNVFITDTVAATGLVSGRAMNVMFRFNGGTMNVMTDEGVSTTNAFNVSAAGRMNLYRASELGTAASITSVACRMPDAASIASTYDNYRVIIGHSVVDTLSATSADNFVSQSVAYDGVLDIAAGLVRGDWLTVNLDTPFQYDGSSNLVVWMGTTSSGAAATHACYMSSESITVYPNQTGTAVPGDVSIARQSYKLDMQLGLAK